MSEMYVEKLGVDRAAGKKLAEITKGYAYAFQELGFISFKYIKNTPLEEILHKLKIELFSYSYEKIWEELSAQDRFFISQISDKEEYKREDLLPKLGDKANMYSVYRDRMIKRGLIKTRYSYMEFSLPFFGEYIREYCME